MSFIKKFLNKETILYLVFGVLTTLVNWITYYVFCYPAGLDTLVANVIAFIAAVIFAFFVNKLFVFESKSFQARVFIKEFIGFMSGRLFTFFIEEGGIWISKITGFEDAELFTVFSFDVTGKLIVKIILSVIVLILNYIIGKLLVFKKSEK